MDFLNTWLVGLSFIVTGVMAKKRVKIGINNKIGYRTKRSKSSNEAWIFANNLASNMYIIGGILAIILAILVRTFITDNVYSLIFVSLLACVTCQLLTEVILRRTFDKRGKRISNNK